MENFSEQTNTTGGEVVKKKRLYRYKIYVVLILITIGAGAYGYLWLKETNRLKAEALSIINKVEQYESLRSEINTERGRCEDFITRREGDFGSFEYCKKFIDWADTLILSEQ